MLSIIPIKGKLNKKKNKREITMSLVFPTVFIDNGLACVKYNLDKYDVLKY